MSKTYDRMPEDWLTDPIRIWQAQISGEKNFEDYAFMGTLNDLQYFENWRDAFVGLEDKTGMAEFIERLAAHYAFVKTGDLGDGRFMLYQTVGRTNRTAKRDPDLIVYAAERYAAAIAEGLRRGGHDEEYERTKSLTVKWLASFDGLSETDRAAYESAMEEHYRSLSIGEAVDFMRLRPGTPDMVYHIKEAVYSMANSFVLTYHLMQSFYDNDLDFSAGYEVVWLNDCIYFDVGDTLYVTPRPERL